MCVGACSCSVKCKTTFLAICTTHALSDRAISPEQVPAVRLQQDLYVPVHHGTDWVFCTAGRTIPLRLREANGGAVPMLSTAKDCAEER